MQNDGGDGAGTLSGREGECEPGGNEALVQASEGGLPGGEACAVDPTSVISDGPGMPPGRTLAEEYAGDWSKMEKDLPRLIGMAVVPRLRDQLYGGVRFAVDLLNASKSRNYHAAVRVLEKFLARPRPGTVPQAGEPEGE
jgi:hypothetical protein